jgi:hypothetical protein
VTVSVSMCLVSDSASVLDSLQYTFFIFFFYFFFYICVALFDFVHLCHRRLLAIYMTFSSDLHGGMYIIVQFLLRRLIQKPTIVCW